MVNATRFNVVMVGPLPPPVHGMAAVNAAVRKRLQESGAKVMVIDLAGESLDRSLRSRLGRLPKVLRGLGSLTTARRLRGGTLYMSISGGLGQTYEILFLLMARLKDMRVYLHHHSFAYLDLPSRLTAILVAVAGRSATHVVLSPGMATQLQGRYPAEGKVIPVSNAALLFGDPASNPEEKLCVQTLGFLSNISAEKGVSQFLNLMAACEAKGLGLRASLAGPFQDAETERRVRQRLSGLTSVEYVGPRYGEEKEAYFASIDVLVFPSLSLNEADPLTIHEALAHAVPVIAYGRGCIGEVVTPDCGAVVDPRDDFVEAAVAQLHTWLGSKNGFQDASRSARVRFLSLLAENDLRWDALLDEIMHAYSDDPHAAPLR